MLTEQTQPARSPANNNDAMRGTLLGSCGDFKSDVPHPRAGFAREHVVLGDALPLAQAAGQVAPSPAVKSYDGRSSSRRSQ